MCIALLSTQHPKYPLIVLSNRDEYLHRPTLRASWWDTPSTSHIFAGRDLARPERGTWLGITRQGRIAILTNFREPSSAAAAIGMRSRGSMVNAFLTAPISTVRATKEWVHNLFTSEGEDGCEGVGGFSLICGTIHPKKKQGGQEKVELEPLAVISNRTTSDKEAHWICHTPDQVHALSNGAFVDETPWPKVALGKELLRKELEMAIKEDMCEENLIEVLFGVLSYDTPPPVTMGKQTYETDLESLRHSVFIPAFDSHQEDEPGTDDEVSETEEGKTLATTKGTPAVHPCEDGVPFDSPRVYGTQKQTVILVDRNGRVKYVERTLYDEQVRWVGGEENKGGRDSVCEFVIEGWND
ncbi:DUF833 domain-containing protein [Kalaharituber pfeilii]|nr:DUF833 domain-containing protein [Kalaharituber pfeilii]